MVSPGESVRRVALFLQFGGFSVHTQLEKTSGKVMVELSLSLQGLETNTQTQGTFISANRCARINGIFFQIESIRETNEFSVPNSLYGQTSLQKGKLYAFGLKYLSLLRPVKRQNKKKPRRGGLEEEKIMELQNILSWKEPPGIVKCNSLNSRAPRVPPVEFWQIWGSEHHPGEILSHAHRGVIQQGAPLTAFLVAVC